MTPAARPRHAPSRRFSRIVATAAGLLSCALAPAAPVDAPPTYGYVTVRGDTLIGLGMRLLTEPARWREIARLNALRDPNRIGTGTVLSIPLRLMRSVAEPATVVAVVGQATTADAAALQAGQAIAEGGSITTGTDGNVTIRLVDGTLLRLRSQSSLQLTESQRLPAAATTRSATRLDRGRAEVDAAPAQAGLPGFRISTPQGVLGVRGTEFRVDADTARSTTRGEVLGGTVAFDGTASNSRFVRAGEGSSIDADGRVALPVPLLAAPDVGSLPALQEQVLMRFALPPMAGAAAYRGQIARDASFDAVVADLTSPTAELRFGDLPDGDYVLRVRAIDPRGLEGRDADHRFRLKARPEAPLPSTPAPGAVQFDGNVEFAWAANAEAAHYRFQLAAGDDFESPLRDRAGITTQSTRIEGLPPGTYRWRVRSIRPDGDAGPWGAPRKFEIRPAPPVPPPPKIGDSSMSFAWPGTPGQTFEFQVARDAAFSAGLVTFALDLPALEMPLPGAGRFYVRLRARDADGFLGPWTAPQTIDLPNCLRDGSGGCVRSGSSGSTLTLAP